MLPKAYGPQARERQGKEVVGIEHMCYTAVDMDRIQKLIRAARMGDWEAEGNPPLRSRPFAPKMRSSPSADFGNASSRQSRLECELPTVQVATPSGPIALIKAMLTTACERDCLYCPFRAGRDYRRTTFLPEELAHTFYQIYRGGAVGGLFLSTGIIQGGSTTQQRLLETAEILRSQLGYEGYLHLKIMPGAEAGQVLQAMRWADRVSVNLEAPTPARLQALAPSKSFSRELLEPLVWIQKFRRELPSHLNWRGRWPSTTT